MNILSCFTFLIIALMILLHVSVKKHHTSFCFFLPFFYRQDIQTLETNTSLPKKIKQWAMDDLTQTVSWLESQEEKVGMPSGKKRIYLCCISLSACLRFVLIYNKSKACLAD